MWPYWLMFMFPAAVAFMQPSRPWSLRPPNRPLQVGVSWTLLAVIASLLIGLRHEVGGDWHNYLEHLLWAGDLTLEEAAFRSEPGYWLVVWAVADLDQGVYLANLVFAVIFSWGLAVFCRAQPRPWLALAVAVPYLVIVLGMGYTRQGVALSLALIGLVALSRMKTWQFIAWIALAATFHRSAVALLPLGIISTPKNRFWVTLWLAAATFALYDVILRDPIDNMQRGYLDAEYQSEGALVRVMMNVVAAGLLLVFRRRFRWGSAERNLWTTMALLALASTIWLALSPSSTAVDRLALYLIPLQLYVFTRLPDLVGRTGGEKRFLVGCVLAYYAAVQFVWLFFATHAGYWLPYRFYLF